MDKIDYDGYLQEIKNNNVIISFGAEWCQNSSKMRSYNEELSEELSLFKYIKINVDENSDLAIKLQIKEIPTTFIYRNGQVQKKIIGRIPKKSYKSIIKKVNM